MDFAHLRAIETADVAGQRVIVRADLNVPLQDGVVTDATRLERVGRGLAQLADRGAKVIVISHFGRPKGKVVPEFSLKPVAAKLSEVLGREVSFVEACIGDQVARATGSMGKGDIIVLENLRFHPGEEANDLVFAKELASVGDLFVSEAFSAAHRAHASTDGIANVLPSYAGPLMMEEIQALRAALDQPKRPTVALVGGAKVSTKIPVLMNLVAKVDKLIIGGGMANTFLAAQGLSVGKSLCEPDFMDKAREILAEAKAQDCEVLLPTDVVVAREFKAGAASQVLSAENVPDECMILDAGPQTIAHLTDVLKTCRTLLWNGPMGAFEIEPFGVGTFALAQAAAECTRAGTLASIAGGGDTVAALNAANVSKDFTYVSTAGGAFLEWLEGRELPGVVALTRHAA